MYAANSLPQQVFPPDEGFCVLQKLHEDTRKELSLESSVFSVKGNSIAVLSPEQDILKKAAAFPPCLNMLLPLETWTLPWVVRKTENTALREDY